MPAKGTKRKAVEKDTLELDQKEVSEEVPTTEKPTRTKAGAKKGNGQTKDAGESSVTKKVVGKGKNATKEALEDKVEKKEDETKDVEEKKKTLVQAEEKDGGNDEPPAKKSKGRGKKQVQEPKEKDNVVEEKSTTTVVIEETVKETVTTKKAGKGKAQAQGKKVESEVVKEKENEEEPATSVEPPSKGKKNPRAKAGTKRKAEDSVDAEGDSQTRRGRSKDVVKGDKLDVGEETTSSKASGNKTDWSAITFLDVAKTKDGRAWNKKFSSWNVNGVRAWLKNESFAYLQKESPDIFCLQETKCDTKDLPMDELKVDGYHDYWSSGDTKGYSGTGVYTKEKPLNVTYGIGIAEHDAEGRAITLEFKKYFFVVTYVPNSGEKVKRLSYRQKWNVDFTAYLKKLDASKPVILCGDLNVAHKEIDLANPKGNTRTAGFTKEERDDFTALLKEGFVDSYRQLYPDKTEAYTYWSYRYNARAKNAGWRLDYFVLSERLTKDVCDCVIRSNVYGSDHCPLVLLMAFD